MERPTRFNGMRHIALTMPNLEECVQFYTEMLGMDILRRAHQDLVYLTCGNDNISLGRADLPASGVQSLDHFGFIVDTKEELEQWFLFLKGQGVTMLDQPHDHNDGARSFHITDPAGNVIQPIYHPAISGQTFTNPE